MQPSVKMPHRRWYFLLCYLAYSSFTCNLVTLFFIRPKLMVMYQMTAEQMHSFYIILLQGMMAGGILFGLLVNIINYRTSFILIWAIQIVGWIKLFSLSPIIVSTPIIHQLKSGMLLLGVANGGIFSIIHPLIALAYQTPQKSQTQIMNYLHTCWPLWVVITCTFEVILLAFNLDWFWIIYLALFISSLYFVMTIFLPLPVQMHAHSILVSTRLKSMVRPGYILLLFCMISSCITQVTPIMWVKTWMQHGLKISPFLFVLYVNILQFFARLLVGPIVNRIAPPTMLVFSSIVTVVSLYMLAMNLDITFVLFIIGLIVLSVSWYWPTYIAIVADRYALSGGLGMGFMSVVGFFAIMHLVPDFSKLIEVEMQQQAFLDLAWFGVFGLILTTSVYIAFRTQGGYKVLSTYDRSL